MNYGEEAIGTGSRSVFVTDDGGLDSKVHMEASSLRKSVFGLRVHDQSPGGFLERMQFLGIQHRKNNVLTNLGVFAIIFVKLQPPSPTARPTSLNNRNKGTNQ